MSGVVVEEGSPLDDYLQENVDPHSLGALGLAAELNDSSGWTGSITSEAGPSRSSSPARAKHDTTAGNEQVENPAAERFRFVVCSSGLLEKEFAPHVPSTPVAPNVESREIGMELPKDVPPTLKRHLWTRRLVERWDLTLAGVVLIGASAWVVPWQILLLVFLALGSAAFLLKDRINPLVRPTTSVTPSPPASTPIASTPPSPAGVYPVEALTDMIAASRELDTAVGAALALLPPDATALTPHHELRLAVHRMTDRMTDHLATASSQLAALVNKEELAVMSRLYDIQLGRRSSHTSPSRAMTSDGGGTADALAALEGRRRQSDVPPSPFKSFAMTPSASMPARVRPPHTQHMSLSHFPLSPSVITPDDKFTNLPLRTPRPKRNSLRQSLSHMEEDATVRRPPRSNRSSWYAGRSRAPSPDAPGRSAAHSPPRLASPASTLHSASPYVPHRSSPLTEAPDRLNRRTSIPIPLLLPPSTRSDNEASFERPLHRYPSALSRMPANEKRRSLQSLPYLRHGEVIHRAVSDEEDQTARIHSLPVNAGSPRAKRRSLRDSLPTAWSLSSSLPSERYFDTIAVSVPKPKPKLDRFPSLSPLTLPALKASCLGVHLKRRKIACSLLALRFEQISEDYWADVSLSLQELTDNTRIETAALHAGLEKAREEVPRRLLPVSTAPWPALSDWSTPNDFAPRDGPHGRLLYNIDTMKMALFESWKQLERAQSSLDSGDTASVGEAWSRIRESLADAVRETERGKEVVRQLNAPHDPGPSHAPDPLDDLPPFMQVWSLSGEDVPLDPSSSLGSGESSVPEELDPAQDQEAERSLPLQVLEDEPLPRPGQDELFEADAAPWTAKERRARRVADDEERVREGRAAQAQAGGEVLLELKGVMELVRSRKGEAPRSPERRPSWGGRAEREAGPEEEVGEMRRGSARELGFSFPPLELGAPLRGGRA